MHRVPVRARAPELVAVRRSILGAQNILTAVSSGPPFRSGTGAVPVGAGAVASNSVGCGASSAGLDRLVLEVLVEVAPVIEGVGETDLLVEGWLIVESDGYEFHSSREQFDKDRCRDQRALAAGYVPIRLSAADVALGDNAIQRTVSRALLGAARSRRLALPNDRGIMRRIEQAAL